MNRGVEIPISNARACIFVFIGEEGPGKILISDKGQNWGPQRDFSACKNQVASFECHFLPPQDGKRTCDESFR